MAIAVEAPVHRAHTMSQLWAPNRRVGAVCGCVVGAVSGGEAGAAWLWCAPGRNGPERQWAS